jgi:hypothetical protein
MKYLYYFLIAIHMNIGMQFALFFKAFLCPPAIGFLGGAASFCGGCNGASDKGRIWQHLTCGKALSY